jgi:hypothetical protein
MKMYPWPFLTDEEGGDFKNSYINTNLNELSARVRAGLFSLEFTPSTNSSYINNQIVNSNLKWEAEVVCGSTFFSETFHVNNRGVISISIPKDELLGDITLSIRIICNREFNYTSEEFSREFDGADFLLKTGDIIGEKTVHWLLDQQFAKAPGLKSIFEFRRPADNEADEHNYVIEDKIIGIILPKRLFEEFQDKYAQADVAKKLYSETVVIGPLVAILSDLSSNDAQTTVERRLVHLLESKGLYNGSRKNQRIQNPLKAAYELLGGDNSLVHLLVKLSIN